MENQNNDDRFSLFVESCEKIRSTTKKNEKIDSFYSDINVNYGVGFRLIRFFNQITIPVWNYRN